MLNVKGNDDYSIQNNESLAGTVEMRAESESGIRKVRRDTI